MQNESVGSMSCAFQQHYHVAGRHHCTHHIAASCAWSSNAWGDDGCFTRLFAEERKSLHQTYVGRSILVLGGSTSRDLAAECMRIVLPPSQAEHVSNSWNASGVQGWELFPRSGKTQTNFSRQYKASVMTPLLGTGWNFTHIQPSARWAGCRSCFSAYRKVDYIAELVDERIRYEFSWKPKLFTTSDQEAFAKRHCHKNYDLVFIGKGLHDAAFSRTQVLRPRAVETRLSHLAKLLECLPQTTLVVLRTPYVSATSAAEQEIVQLIAGHMRAMGSQWEFPCECLRS